MSLDPDSTLSYEEVGCCALKCLHENKSINMLIALKLDFAFDVWQAFPSRIVGFSPRDHYYDEQRSDWFYTSKWTNQYSIVLLDAAFYHRFELFLVTIKNIFNQRYSINNAF